MTTPIRLSSQVRRIQQSEHHSLANSRTNLESSRWQNPPSWGARHINDTAPFTLWDQENRKFRTPDSLELQWIREKYDTGNMGQSDWFLWIETANPPQPIPFTIGCMPAIFVGIGESLRGTIPHTPYPNPRMQYPCAGLIWPKMTLATKQQYTTLITALSSFASIRAILYLPNWTIVELKYDDGHKYELRSLPGIVAGQTTLYHHEKRLFNANLRSQARIHFTDPAQYMSNSESFQDNANYLRQLRGLIPGDMIAAGSWCEVDGMSSDSVSLMAYGKLYMVPSANSSEIPFERWTAISVNAIFGATNTTIRPAIVQSETSNVTGFVHSSNGNTCLSVHDDDLIAEDWQIVV